MFERGLRQAPRSKALRKTPLARSGRPLRLPMSGTVAFAFRIRSRWLGASRASRCRTWGPNKIGFPHPQQRAGERLLVCVCVCVFRVWFRVGVGALVLSGAGSYCIVTRKLAHAQATVGRQLDDHLDDN